MSFKIKNIYFEPSGEVKTEADIKREIFELKSGYRDADIHDEERYKSAVNKALKERKDEIEVDMGMYPIKVINISPLMQAMKNYELLREYPLTEYQKISKPLDQILEEI